MKGPKSTKEDVWIITTVNGEERHRVLERSRRVVKRVDGREWIRRVTGTAFVERDATGHACVFVQAGNLRVMTGEEFLKEKK